jgi:hypothetical protein
MTGEPDMCNPASFENVSHILSNIADRAGINKDGEDAKKWLFSECDGGIYTIVEKLIFNTMKCLSCEQVFYGSTLLMEHRCKFLHGDVAQAEHQFGWLITLPGLLHVYMNACKAFFDLNWEVFLKDILI